MYVSMRVSLGGGRVAWWAWDSRNGSCCVWVCVYVVSYLQQLKPLHCLCPPSTPTSPLVHVRSHFEQEMRGRGKEEGEKKHRGKMEAEISVAEWKRSPWAEPTYEPQPGWYLQITTAEQRRFQLLKETVRDRHFLSVHVVLEKYLCNCSLFFIPPYQLHPDQSSLFHVSHIWKLTADVIM